LHVGAAGTGFDRRPVQAVEQDVAVVVVVRVARSGAVLEQDVAVHPPARGKGRGLPGRFD
jgi:hypothetical protein